MPRTVWCELAGSGRRLGPFHVESPWWQEVGSVVAAVQAATGLEVLVLRLLTTKMPSPHLGGEVSYLCEPAVGPVAVLPAARNRAWWASPGGLRDALGWARQRLASLGHPVLATEQVKTWNLSVVVRLVTPQGPVWLKAVPTFMADEGAVLAELSQLTAARGLLPEVLARNPGRRLTLLADLPGRDFWDAGRGDVTDLGRRLIALQVQARATGLDAALQRLAVDRRLPGLVDGLRRCAQSVSDPLRGRVLALAGSLPGLARPIEVFGDVVLHGDPHPGNARTADGVPPVLLDWGDLAFGSPLLDAALATARLPAEARDDALADWVGVLLTSPLATDAPADLALLVRLARVLDAVANAVTYDSFCRGIEDSELVYHRADVPAALLVAVRAADRLVAAS